MPAKSRAMPSLPLFVIVLRVINERSSMVITSPVPELEITNLAQRNNIITSVSGRHFRHGGQVGPFSGGGPQRLSVSAAEPGAAQAQRIVFTHHELRGEGE